MSKADLTKKLRNFAWLCGCLFIFFCGFPGGITSAQADLGGVKGKYSDWLDELIRSKSYEALVKDPSQHDSPEPVSVTCLDTPEDKYYIGVVQNMRVKAPLEKLQAVVEDIASYDQLFPDYAKIRVDSREGNRIMTFWENKVPVFFIPNVRYRMIYQLDLSDPNIKFFRYQLEKKGNLVESDGFIVLTKLSETETRYLEIDFFNADWGMATTFAPGRIWPDSVDVLYISDLAFQLKAEHPLWTNNQCRTEAEKTVDLMKQKPGRRCADALIKDWRLEFPKLPPFAHSQPK